MQHAGLASGRWKTLSLTEQLAHIGSEFSRALRAYKIQNSSRFEAARIRMLELMGLSLSDPRWILTQRREIARLKEHILTHFETTDASSNDLDSLERYFEYFTIADRKR